jgi:hypothetical protein
VRLKGGMVGMVMAAALVGAPSASAATASLRGGNTVVYQGDTAKDTVTLSRYVDNRGNQYYLVTDDGGIASGTGCVNISNNNNKTSACRVSQSPPRYEISTGAGDDSVNITAPTSAGTADLGAGNDHFTGQATGASADTVTGGDGDDTISGGAGADPLDGGTGNDSLTGGAGNDSLTGGAGVDSLAGGDGNDAMNGGADADVLSGGTGNDRADGGDGDDRVSGDDGADAVTGGAGNDEVAGQAGNDTVDGGAGDDSLEFGAADMAAGAGVGADDLHGGTGVDRLSYLDHTSAITVTLDEQPGDGGAGEGDNVHDDIETVIATTHDDVLTGDDASQDLYGNAGNDLIDGRGGDDLVNGGSGEDVLYGGAGDDAIEGSAGGDYLDGGPGQDLFTGDNDCTADPCTGGSDEIHARDGEQDEVNCGVGADKAIVDAVDIVAVDSQQGCESVDRAGAAAAPAAASAPLPPAAATAAAASMRLVGVRRLRTLRRGKLRLEVKCPGACKLKARLILGHSIVVSAARTRIDAGTETIRLKPSRSGKRRLKRRTKATMTLVVDVTDAAGAQTTLARSLAFKR